MSLIFTRLMLIMYLLQYANVRWNGSLSECFEMRNGVKQGAVLSAILYCFYVNGLFQLLRQRKSGCWIQGTFHGIFGYADDNFLLAPSTEALQEMINTCQEYCQAHNLRFSTDPNPKKSKTKCMSFLFKQREIPKLSLGGNPLPWVPTGKHLGINLENTINGLKKDILIKRAKFIDKSNEIMQEFYFAHPDTLLQLNMIYNSHFYGSPLWDLFSKECQMVENAWNVSVRKIFNLPRTTHRILIQPITETSHVKTLLIKRFLQFIDQIERCPKPIVKNLLRIIKKDVNSTTGSNLRKIMNLCNKKSIEELIPEHAHLILYHPIPEEELWRLGIIKDVVDSRFNRAVIGNFSNDDLNDILDFACTS